MSSSRRPPLLRVAILSTSACIRQLFETSNMGRLAEAQRRLLEVSKLPEHMRNPFLPSAANDGPRSNGYPGGQSRLVERKSL